MNKPTITTTNANAYKVRIRLAQAVMTAAVGAGKPRGR
jgi:hypothetical protein